MDDPSVSMLCPDIKENIKNHCLHCFRATKAPLPCDVRSKRELFYFDLICPQNCCSVVFCSRKCKSEANESYHKMECQMKLYEMFEHEVKVFPKKLKCQNKQNILEYRGV